MKDREASRRTVVLFWLAFGIILVLGVWWVGDILLKTFGLIFPSMLDILEQVRGGEPGHRVPPLLMNAFMNASLTRIAVVIVAIVAMIVFWFIRIRVRRHNKRDPNW
jgi:hypothetical protein